MLVMFATSNSVDIWFTSLITSWVAAMPLIAILLILIGLDIATGVLAAFITKQISSMTSFTGVLKKVVTLSLVAVGICMEFIYPDIPWGRIVAMFFCVTEIISITENAARCGIPLPPQLVEALARLKSEQKAKPMVTVEIKNTTPGVEQPSGILK